MRKRKLILATSLILLLVLVAACTPQAAPAPAPKASAPAAVSAAALSAPAAAAKPAWQQKWEAALAGAKKEGKLVIATTGGNELRLAVTRGIKDAYGVVAEVVSGRGPEMTAKVFAERRAGLYLEDVFIDHPNTTLNEFKPAGVWAPLDAFVLLPEVTDPKLWYKGEVPFLDRDHTAIGFSAFPGRPIAINTNLVKPDDLKSWRDLLLPKWKGKLVLNDPTVAGAGQQSVVAMDLIMGWDYVKELAKAEPEIMRDQRQQLEWLAHGKISILIGPKTDVFAEFAKIGAPVAIVEPTEGNWLTAGGVGCIAMYNHTPHPDTATVFLNWLLSKDGQTLFSNALLQQSARADVSTASLPPDLLRQPGKKYTVVFDEAALTRFPATSKMTRELFEPLVKK